MLLTELSAARIPDVYQQVAAVIGDSHWRDKGRKIHKREVLDFYRLPLPHMQSTIKGLGTGLSAVLTDRKSVV